MAAFQPFTQFTVSSWTDVTTNQDSLSHRDILYQKEKKNLHRVTENILKNWMNLTSADGGMEEETEERERMECNVTFRDDDGQP